MSIEFLLTVPKKKNIGSYYQSDRDWETDF